MLSPKVRVGLFVTCLVDLIRPSVGFASVKLLENAGCAVDVPDMQTCCGQPAYNSGDRKDTIAIARDVIAAFKGFDYVVVPSGSCAGMIKLHYPDLFAENSAEQERHCKNENLHRSPLSPMRKPVALTAMLRPINTSPNPMATGRLPLLVSSTIVVVIVRV